ncbi:hypothetical protein FNV43_RR25753 [Rhamnella rubrinervis]|uniref:Uncharacterized protein n=1 Tax=Rhamnella rubrinervis TaxID=2594499 RepID=A0A8K0GNN3_9ROSA|nr:hypothetical protein FNV43_RR25753 [Rhamnella rubrinervis]
MDTDSHKRRSGFMKSLYKAAKPRKVKPNPTATNGYGGVKMQQNHSIPQQLQCLLSAAYEPSSVAEVHGHGDHHIHDYNDENVDMKAATYVSYVRERFKLERSNSNQRMNQEML